VNCLHIIPDLKKLEAKYRNELVVIGVHSAKFSSEKQTEGIRDAILRYELEHPVINDKDFVVWNSYGAQAWPTLVLVDQAGNYVGSQSGEGTYSLFDQVIGTLIQEGDKKGQINRKPIKLVLEKDKKPKSVLSYPGKIAVDERGSRLFFTDSNHNRIVVTSLAGAIQEVIGQGEIGLKDGDFATARFFRPQGLSFDPIQNALYVADTENHAIRKIDFKAKKVITVAGTGEQSAAYPPIGGIGTKASLNSPWDVLLHGDTLYIAMAGSHQLWSMDVKTLTLEPYAGDARENITDGPLLRARLAQPSGLATDGKTLYFADSEVSAIRTADLGGKGSVETIIGTGLFDFGDVDGKYPEAKLQHPLGVAYLDGQVYVADAYNHKIKRVDPKAKTVVTFIGTGKHGMQDGPAKSATLYEPNGLAIAGGKMYISDTNNHLIRVFDFASQQLSTLRLTGLEKLTPKTTATVPAGGRVITMPAQEVAAGATAIDLVIQLPKGMKLNKEAPFLLKASSSKPEAVGVTATVQTKAAPRLTIPIKVTGGEATLTVDLQVSYCNEGNEGLCYFKEARLLVPVKVTTGGSAAPVVTYTL
jgi:DNA-binding beta-propeller fold protein YncE